MISNIFNVNGPQERTIILTEVTFHSRALILLKLGNSITEKCYYQLLLGKGQTGMS